MSLSRVFTMFSWILTFVIVILVIWSFLSGTNLQLRMLTVLAFAALPYLIKQYIPPWVIFLLNLTLVIVVVSSLFNLYRQFFWLDGALHVLIPFDFAIVLSYLVWSKTEGVKPKWFWVIFITLSATGFAAIWEIYELVAEKYLVEQNFIGSIAGIIKDLFLGLIGGLLGSILVYYVTLDKKDHQ